MKIKKIILNIFLTSLVAGFLMAGVFDITKGFSLLGARTDGLWELSSYNVVSLSGGGDYDVLIPGSNKHINFGYDYGDTGYGFRDNNGTIQYKNSGGSWSDFSSGGGGTSAFWASTTNDSLIYPLNGRGIIVGASATTTNIGQTLEVHKRMSVVADDYNYVFAIDPDNASGPQLQLGNKLTTPDAYLRIGAWAGINNFDTKARDLKIYSSYSSNAFFLESSNGYIGINTSVPLYRLDVNGDSTTTLEFF